MENIKYNKIETYLDGKMNDEEKGLFELELKQDKELLGVFETRKVSRMVIELGIREQKKAQVAAIHKALKEAQKPTVIRQLRPWLAAAAAILLLLFAYSGYQMNMHSNKNLVAGNFDAYPDMLTQMGNETPYLTGLKAYNKKNFDEAILAFDKVNPSDEEYSVALFYKGVAEMAINSAEATKTLESFIANYQSHELFEAAEWYFAISNLQAGNEKTAKTILDSIRKGTGHAYMNQADQLMNDLDSFWRL